MKTIITLIFSSALSITSIAQPAQRFISGTVKDTKNEAVPDASVRLLKVADSSEVRGGITNKNGKFEFNDVDTGSYLLAITAIAQKQFTSSPVTINDARSNIVLPVIILLPVKGVALMDVVVKATRPLLEQEIDKTVVNVGSMISSATSNTLEVLEKTPGVTVSAGGDISLNGRGVLVLIDGRTTYMSGQDLAAYLKSVPGSVVEKIELIDNPSARYDAAGNAIINIRLKKNRAGGFTGNVSTGYSQGRYARNNQALNINYNHKKVNVFGNFGYNREKSYSDDIYDRRFFNTRNEPSSAVSLINSQTFRSNGINVNTGLDYAASANTTFGFIVNVNRNKRYGMLDYTSDNYTSGNIPDTTGRGSVIGGDKRTNVGLNLNFQHKLGKSGGELSGDVNYLSYRNNGDQSLQNFLYKPGGILTAANHFLYLLPSDIDIYTVKADYVHPIKNKTKLEAGFKSSMVENNNISDYYTVMNSTLTKENTKSNHFKYHENINAAYVNGQKSWKRVAIQIGLRFENTQAVGQQVGNAAVSASRFTKNYSQLFPSMYVSYKLDTLGKNTLTVSINRRISRPNYQSLNPFLFFRDNYSYSGGNPMLTPQYQYRYEVKFQHKQFLRMGLSYNRFTDVIFQTTEAVADVFIIKPNNIAKGYMLLLNTGLSVTPAKWWSLNSDVLLSRLGLNGVAYTERLNPSFFVARINVYNQLKFSKVWSAEVGAYYASRDLSGQAITSGMYRANASLQKKIWKDKGSIRISFDDIFHSWVYHNRSVSLKQAQYFQITESDTQRVGIAFTYRFGNDTFSRKRKHNNNASSEEKGRVE